VAFVYHLLFFIYALKLAASFLASHQLLSQVTITIEIAIRGLTVVRAML